PIGSLQHNQALRGFSEAGIKLAQVQLRAGRRDDARRIALGVLAERPNYGPALKLLRRTETPLSEERIHTKAKAAAAPSAAASPRTINSSTPGREAWLGAREEQPLRAAPPPRA